MFEKERGKNMKTYKESLTSPMSEHLEEEQSGRKNKAEMAKLAEKAHKEDTENWTDGTMECFWFDNDGNLCIRYNSGKWWHYKKRKEGWW